MSASDERVRLFVALELPGGVVSALVRWRDDIVTGETGLRAVPPSSLHVTLCFLGSQPATAVPDIIAACGVVGSLPAAALTVERPVWLPPRRPRVLAVELGDAAGRLGDVQAALSDALHAGGWYTPEKRPYLAHVTVARVPGRMRVRPRELTAPESDPGGFTGSCVTLFRSHLSSAGARYEPLASVQLGG